MFFLKKLVSRFFFPVPLCAGLLLFGLGLWYFTKRKRAGRGCVVAGTVLLLFFSYSWLPDGMLRQLESPIAPVLIPTGHANPISSNYICILGQGISSDTSLPANARFNDIFLKRMVEGVRLHRLLPNPTFLVSIAGSNVSQEEKQAVLGGLLRILGLESETLPVCATARDTNDEITWFKQIAGTNRVFLVSCASHLPRAMVLAKKHSLNAIPSPSGYLAGRVEKKSPLSRAGLFPTSENLAGSERAIYEYLGLAWEKVKGSPKSEVRDEKR
jgi:uncharacterized SAM-binding protein YcdF (DUF218 family)